jgi:hypothetical protein
MQKGGSGPICHHENSRFSGQMAWLRKFQGPGKFLLTVGAQGGQCGILLFASVGSASHVSGTFVVMLV